MDCVLIEQNINIAGTNFLITSANIYVPVFTLSINGNIKFYLENIKQGFKRTISWNEYRFEINNQIIIIDPTFRNINRFFVLSFKDGDNDPTRDSFEKYCMSLIEVKDLNPLIDNKPFFDHPVENKEEAYEELIKISKNDYYTTSYWTTCIIKNIINSLE